ncbi:hypothetical protein ACSZNS_16305, partial [Aeromonas caviae]
MRHKGRPQGQETTWTSHGYKAGGGSSPNKKGSSRDLGEVEVDRQGAGKLAVSKHTTTITLLSP